MQEQNVNSNTNPAANQNSDTNISPEANQNSDTNINPQADQKQGNSTSKNASPEGMEENANEKTMGGLAYLIFFLPLIACPQSQYARFHANQALVLVIVAVAGNIILGLIPVVGWIIMPIFSICIVALEIYGLINGFTGKMKKLPVIGSITILK